MRMSPFKLERYFAEHEFTAQYLLCASDCEAMSCAELLGCEPGAAAERQEFWLGYAESPGHPVLRAEIAALYESTGADDVLVHTGAEAF